MSLFLPIRLFLALTLFLCLVGCGSVLSGTKAAPPKADISADSLIVAVDDVAQIADFRGFMSEHTVKSHHPVVTDPGAPADCRAIYDENVTFGESFKEFSSAIYAGLTDEYIKRSVSVSQGIGVYSDAISAQATFDRLADGLEKCSLISVEKYKVTVTRPDPATILVDAKAWKAAYRVKSSVLMDTVVGGLSNSKQVAQAVVDRIADRVQ